MRASFPFLRRVTIKLEARRTVLYGRIKKKSKNEQGGEWLFGETYRDKCEFVRKLFEDFKKIPTDIKIDTNEIGPNEALRIILKKLKDYALYDEINS